MTERITAAEYRRRIAQGPDPGARGQKFNVASREARTYAGRIYASKAEARFAAKLDTLQAAGQVLRWHPQVIFLLPGGTMAVIDFLVIYPDGSIHYYDVKGVRTKSWVRNQKQIRALYGIEIGEIPVR